jgi:hypothetical protein
MTTYIQALKERLAGVKKADTQSLGPSATERAGKILNAKEGLAQPAGTVAPTSEAEKALTAAGEAQKKLENQSALAGIQAQEQAAEGDLALATKKLSEQKRQKEAEIGQGQVLAAGARQTTSDLAQKELEQRLALRSREMNQGFDRAVADLTTNRQIEVNDIFAQFRQSDTELRHRRDAAQVEQLGFLMALRDKEYVDEVRRVGTLRRLSDDLSFKREAFALAAGHQTEALIKEMGHQEWLTMSEAELMETLAGIDIDSAMSMANTAIRQANTEAVISGVSTLAAKGVDRYMDKPKSKSDVKTPADSADKP